MPLTKSKYSRSYLRTHRALLCGLLVVSVVATVSATRHERMVSEWRPTNYDVALTLDDKLSEITKARVVINLQVLKKGVSKIDFDFGEMQLDSVSIDGQPAKFDRASAMNAYAALVDELLRNPELAEQR